MSLSKRLSLFALLILAAGFPVHTFAATMGVSVNSPTVVVGDILTAQVLINTEGISINNAEGTLSFPTDTLQVISVAKSPSIFSLWIQDPSFSNIAGTVSFNGGVPTPGFTGTGGVAVTITFRATKSGTATLALGNASVRANDGLGTEVLRATTGTTLTLQGVAPAPAPTPTSSGASLSVSSATHPDQHAWYADSTPQLAWTLPSGTDAVQTVVSQHTDAAPLVSYNPPISGKTLDALADGTWYFGVRAHTASGWGSVTRYTLNIDTTPPDVSTIAVSYSDASGMLSLTQGATDSTSGIAYYQVSIDGSTPTRIPGKAVAAGTASVPIAAGGDHTATIQAFDRAGKEATASKSFSVVRTAAPTIDSYSRFLNQGAPLVVSGTASQGSADVTVFVAQGSVDPTQYHVAPDAQGHFTFQGPALPEGTYTVWVASESAAGVRSDNSASVTVTVSSAALIHLGPVAVTVPLLITLILLVSIATFLVAAIGWYRFYQFRKKVRIGVRRAERDMHRGAALLKEDLEKHLAMLLKARSRRKLSPVEESVLSGLETNILDLERFIARDLEQIEQVDAKPEEA